MNRKPHESTVAAVFRHAWDADAGHSPWIRSGAGSYEITYATTSHAGRSVTVSVKWWRNMVLVTVSSDDAPDAYSSDYMNTYAGAIKNMINAMINKSDEYAS